MGTLIRMDMAENSDQGVAYCPCIERKAIARAHPLDSRRTVEGTPFPLYLVETGPCPIRLWSRKALLWSCIRTPSRAPRRKGNRTKDGKEQIKPSIVSSRLYCTVGHSQCQGLRQSRRRCHPERSEGSQPHKTEVLRCAQHNLALEQPCQGCDKPHGLRMACVHLGVVLCWEQVALAWQSPSRKTY